MEWNLDAEAADVNAFAVAVVPVETANIMLTPILFKITPSGPTSKTN